MMFKHDYWDRRYKKGGNSGNGSYGIHREWKWGQIEKAIPEIHDVLDIGCGDLRFWEGRDCRKYTGLDISSTILAKDIEARQGWAFIRGDASVRYPLSANVVLCMDMLFHIMDDLDYENVLDNLMAYSKEWLVIYTWDLDPFDGRGTDGKYQRFRKLPLHRFDDFELIAHEREPFDNWGAIYIFKRKWTDTELED